MGLIIIAGVGLFVAYRLFSKSGGKVLSPVVSTDPSLENRIKEYALDFQAKLHGELAAMEALRVQGEAATKAAEYAASKGAAPAPKA